MHTTFIDEDNQMVNNSITDSASDITQKDVIEMSS